MAEVFVAKSKIWNNMFLQKMNCSKGTPSTYQSLDPLHISLMSRGCDVHYWLDPFNAPYTVSCIYDRRSTIDAYNQTPTDFFQPSNQAAGTFIGSELLPWRCKRTRRWRSPAYFTEGAGHLIEVVRTVRACIRSSWHAWLVKEFTDADLTSVSIIEGGKSAETYLASIYLNITRLVWKVRWLHLIQLCNSQRKGA